MNGKKLFAVIAVVMMVFAAFIPFGSISSSSDDGAATDTNKATISLYDILNSLTDIGSGKTIALNGMTLVPTDDEIAGEEITINSSVIGTQVVSSGESVTISGDYVFGDGVKANNGKILVKEGAGIYFCKPNENGTFTLQNKNIGSNNLIIAESGALISILGVTFKVYCGGSDAARFSVPIIALTGSNKSVVTFASTYSDGKQTFKISVPSDVGYSKLTLFNLADFHVGTVLELKDMTVTKTGNTITFSDAFVNMTIMDGRYSYIVKSTGNNRTNISLTMDSRENVSEDGVKTVTVDIAISGNIKLDSIISNFKASQTAEEKTVLEVTDFALSINNLKAEVVNTITDTGAFKREISTTCDISMGTNGKMALSIGKFVKNDNIGTIPVEFTFKGISIELTGLELSFREHTTGTASQIRELDAFHSEFNLKLDVDSTQVDVEVVWWKLNLTHIEDIVSSIEGVTTTYDVSNKIFETSVGTFGINGKLAPAIATLSGDASVLNVAATVSSFTLTQKEGQNYSNLKFNLLTDISVYYDGDYRHMAVAVNGFDGTMSDDESVRAYKISSFAVKNDIPFSKAMVAGLFEQNCIGYLTATGLEITESGNAITVKGKTFDVQCNTIVDGIADVVGLTMNSGFTMYVSDNLIIESSVITGFLKNIADSKEQYVIRGLSTDAPAKVTIAGINKPYFVWQVKLESCNATFGKGLLPADLVIAGDSSFRANGLSAFDFTFESGSTVSGNVVFDLADKLIYPDRKIVAGENVLTVYTNGDVGEYSLTMNLTDMTGTVDAKKGFKIVDGNPKTFSFDRTMELKNYCEANETYNIYLEDGSVLVSLHCNETWTVSIDPQYGQEWSDGSGKTYKNGDVYTMPAKNMVFTKVVTKSAEMTEVGGKTVAYADSQSVEVTGSDIVGKDVTVVVDGASIAMDNKTLERIGVDTDNKLTVSMIKVTEMDESTSAIVGNGSLYSIVLKINGSVVSSYSYSTSFEVTIRGIQILGDVDGFNVSYMDSTGHLTSVGVEGYEKCDDGTYNVTFVTNHFSDFMVEPISDGNTAIEFPQTVAAVIAIAIILIACYGAFDYVRRK